MTSNPSPKDESTGGKLKDPSSSINTPADLQGKKQAVSKVNIKKYKYDVIQLYLDKDREKLLKDCCSFAGIHPSRVDDHQQDVIWELLSWVEPVLKIRRYLVELMGPVVNCTPERIRMQK